MAAAPASVLAVSPLARFNGKTPSGGFHRRRLAPPAIAMSSAAGRELHKEAWIEGGMTGFLRLIEAFHTQNEPAFCGLGTLVNVLNALEVDPGEVWKGAWRWYSESMLSCCVDLDEVKQRGLTFDEWTCLAKCQGLSLDVAVRASESTPDAFRAVVRSACATTDKALCVAYSRRAVGQSGGGHYSPIGGYHAAQDLVLVLDVARFKHPPHWLPLATLFDAMSALDASTGKSRGFAVLSRGRDAATVCLRLTFGRGRVDAAKAYFGGAALADAADAAEELWLAVRDLPPLAASLVDCSDGAENTDFVGGAAAAAAAAVLAELKATPLYAAIATLASGRRPLPVPITTAVALILLLPALLADAELARALPKSHALLRATEAELWRETGRERAADARDGTAKGGSWAGEGATLAGELRTVREQLRLLADPACGVLCSTGCCVKE